MRQVNWPLLALFVVVWLILGQLFMGHAVHLVWALEGTILEFCGFKTTLFYTNISEYQTFFLNFKVVIL